MTLISSAGQGSSDIEISLVREIAQPQGVESRCTRTGSGQAHCHSQQGGIRQRQQHTYQLALPRNAELEVNQFSAPANSAFAATHRRREIEDDVFLSEQLRRLALDLREPEFRGCMGRLDRCVVNEMHWWARATAAEGLKRD